MDIATRLKEFRKKTKIKMPAIAAATGISKENLYKWEKGTKPSDFNLFKNLERYLDEMENAPAHILEDAKLKGANQASSLSTALFTGIFLSQDENALLLRDNNAVPGSIITINNKPVLVAWRMDAPFIGPVDGAIPVTGDSMEPTFKSGNLVALKKLRFIKIINAGYFYYVIDKNHKGLLRRLRPAAESNSIILSSENEELYPETTRSFDDVLAIFSVEAVIMK
jgi:phage repressor protein C with HTH and peptisase S24 domain